MGTTEFLTMVMLNPEKAERLIKKITLQRATSVIPSVALPCITF